MDPLFILFPKRCVGCGKLGQYFCVRCTKTIQYIGKDGTICPVCQKPSMHGMTHSRCRTKYTIDGLTSVFRFHGGVRGAIKQLKYRYVRDLLGELISLFPGDAFDSIGQQEFDGIVPIPLHSSRMRERGFNQAEILIEQIPALSKYPRIGTLLKRTRQKKHQAEIRTRSERKKNMKGAFALKGSRNTPSSVILFDDVYTTGATILEAARTLKHGGVTFVWGITIAR